MPTPRQALLSFLPPLPFDTAPRRNIKRHIRKHIKLVYKAWHHQFCETVCLIESSLHVLGQTDTMMKFINPGKTSLFIEHQTFSTPLN